ncbi:MAG: DUF3303 family protein [Nitrososphaeraceae archaeon]
MSLYGIFGIHSVESCPLNNAENRNLVIKMAEELDKVANRNNTHILHRYHSGLEHTFVWIADAQSAHSIQSFMTESAWAKFNAIKIVPLTAYETVIEECKRLETS